MSVKIDPAGEATEPNRVEMDSSKPQGEGGEPTSDRGAAPGPEVLQKIFENVRYEPELHESHEDLLVNHPHPDLRNRSPDSMGEPVPTPLLKSVRFRTAVMCWFGMACLYAQRTNLSIAMVCMAKSQSKNTTDTSSKEESKCPELDDGDSAGEFDWDKTLQGNILGSFFYGYLILQIPGGMLSERFGAKHVITLGMLPVAVLTLLTPVLTRIHYIVLLVVRVVIGLGEAVMYPGVTALWAKWAPPNERTLLVGVSLSGGQFGNAFILPIGGLLCANVSWDSVFYFIGSFGLLFCILWMAWVKGSPEQHTGLSEKERIYLERTVPRVSKDGPKHGTPWKAIFTSGPFLAVLMAHVFGNYTYYMNMTQIPTYMKEVLKFNIESNGAFSMIPYLVFWLSMMGAGALSDFIIQRKVPTVVVRKSFAFIGLIGPAVFMVATSYMDCTKKYVAVFFLCCAVGATGFGFSSYLVNHGDLAPDYAGTLFGITNCLATLPGFVAPPIVGLLTPDGTVSQWRTAFFVAAAINVIGAVIYVLFAKATIQPWSSAIVAKQKKAELTESEERMEKIKEIYLGNATLEAKRRDSTIRKLSSIMPS